MQAGGTALLGAPATFWALGPLVAVLDLFDGGRRRAELDIREAEFPGNGVLERLVIEAKARRITVVDRRGPLGTCPRGSAVAAD